ncbi:EAL domain, c-di-GMP-specific phosphodiesterase class I (or its enzymatically inactive variant) [Nitrosomonas aestuarii]|uniref:EAL domain, c-di-GMP-specific phosphodiesterase class I (Or its enzymatically inactive variant) n=1 Tax=Nitrosomonas aestuarii TaxID=52441 RepID=A0A1I4GYC8_9PROT|nr:EAL domain-containing response regulator [Nitrosomonas aestuarii]SFL34136.1 EAL domain, c-di-GMP-specific phosphodiesterase class I (or its enzymatically inactive variant) [Nitrosomonas aestuarii]
MSKSRKAKKQINNILIIDDDPVMQKQLTHMLAELGYFCSTCFTSAAAALIVYHSPNDRPEMILLDINMPGVDGLEFMRHLAGQHYSGGLILVGGEDNRTLYAAERLARQYRLSITGSLCKPFALADLSTLLKKYTSMETKVPQSISKIYDADAVRDAIYKGQLVNYYQPKVAINKSRTVGVEALVRWQHPEDGLVSPDKFIPVAEANDLINALTRVVIKSALIQAKAWQESGLVLCTSVNITMNDLSNYAFADFLISETAAVGISPESLVLEVTESQMMQNLAAVLDTVVRLKMNRFRFSIDDFGTGYTSFVQLRDIPFDELKIDRSSIHRAMYSPRLCAIFESTLQLCNQLGLDVVAEGVEDIDDWNFLCAANYALSVQGYFIAHPMPAADVFDWIQDWQACAHDRYAIKGRQVT